MCPGPRWPGRFAAVRPSSKVFVWAVLFCPTVATIPARADDSAAVETPSPLPPCCDEAAARAAKIEPRRPDSAEAYTTVDGSVVQVAAGYTFAPDYLIGEPTFGSLGRGSILPSDDIPIGDADGAINDGQQSAEQGPEHIRDNAFLVEEAANQEPGVVQHIFNWIIQWDSTPGARTRDFAATYTMELPLGSQTHQFSFITQFQTAFEDPNTGPVTQQGDVGDTFLNYRYQLLADDQFLWCAPRFTLILPTGDKRFGFGTGELGYQFNLPISRYGERFDFHFNAGATLIPHVSLPLSGGGASAPQDLRAYNLGASTFWKPQTFLHFFVEGLYLRNEEIDDLGFRNGLHQVFVNPGVRYAICQFDEVEWVIGVSSPIGVSPDSPDIGVFAYMSVEHIFRRIEDNGQHE